jgi:hypothetical protein
VAVDDGGCEIDELAIIDPCSLAQHLERLVPVDAMTLHENALGSLDQCAPAECASQIVILGKAAQYDVDRTLPIIDVFVVDMREHASLGGLPDESGVVGVKEHDYGAGGLAHDLLDRFEGMLGTIPQANERNVGSLPDGHGGDISNVNLSRDDLVAQVHHDRRDERQAILPLIRDQNPQSSDSPYMTSCSG